MALNVSAMRILRHTFLFLTVLLLQNAEAADSPGRRFFVPPEWGNYREELVFGEEGIRGAGLLVGWDLAPRFASGSIAKRIVFGNSLNKSRAANPETARISIISGEIAASLVETFDDRRSVQDYNPYNPNRRRLSGQRTTSWNAEMELNEKGYYFTVLMFGLFAAISVQKAVRDQLEGIPVTNIYYGLAWFSTILSIILLTVGLWNADLTKSEKGFYAMAFVLSLFSAIAVQKNTRDMKAAKNDDPETKEW
jgi:uncharacterized membrane protein YiaA